MTENRFDYTAYDDGTESIYDRKEDEYYFDMQLSEIEEIMNKLAEENEQLKQKVNFYKYFQKDARELEKENEQLKQQVEDLEFTLRTIKAFDRTVKEDHSDTVYVFQKKIEKW